MYPLTQCALLITQWSCAVCPTGACDVNPRAEPPNAALTVTTAPYTITVSTDKPATIAEEALTVELIGVKDNRCAVEVQCVWAGYAEVALRVSKAGAAAGSVIVGALAPSPDGAPVPTYGGYRFSLVGLEPGNSISKPAPQALYRATLTVAMRQ